MNAGGNMRKYNIDTFIVLLIVTFSVQFNCSRIENEYSYYRDRDRVCNVIRFCNLYTLSIVDKLGDECKKMENIYPSSAYCVAVEFNKQNALCNFTLHGNVLETDTQNVDWNCY
jgi:hypothetical protein